MKNAIFRQKYMSLDRSNKLHVKVKKQIIAACNINQVVFYNWTQGLTYVPEKYHNTIAEIMGIPVGELFPNNQN